MKSKKMFFAGAVSIVMFIIWTVLVCTVDIGAIGPEGSSVGFSSMNKFIHKLTGANTMLYVITDWLGIVPFAVAFIFAVLGFIQLIKRRSILRVDRDILLLGIFYLTVIILYILFENLIINFRPVLIEGALEASYPSSTTLLVLCVMPTAAIQMNYRIKNNIIRKIILLMICFFSAFMIVGRILSGVHWISDIIGGVFLSTGLDLLYCSIVKIKMK